MTNNSLRHRSLSGLVIVLCLPMMRPFLFASVAYAAQAAGQTQTSLPSRATVPATARESSNVKVRIFDNNLLDKIFAHDRAAAKQDNEDPEKAAVNEGGEKKPFPPMPSPALLLPSDSFSAKINSRTPASLAAALRFAEQGRRQISLRRYQKAVSYFERAVGVGLRNYLPYIYYYLAETHHHLANYQSAFNFLEVAESWLSDHYDWMTSIAALRQQNVNAMGYAQAPTRLKTQ